VIPAISGDTFEAALEEANHAVAKHGEHQTPLCQHMDRRDKLVILVEELGEVAHALTYDAGDLIAPVDNLRVELFQLAAMALMWAQSEER